MRNKCDKVTNTQMLGTSIEKIRPLTTKKIFDYEFKTPYIIHNTFIGD